MSRQIRIFAPKSCSLTELNREIELSREDTHHLKHVLRATPGTLLTLVDTNNHREYSAVISSISDTVLVRIIAQGEIQLQARSRVITLAVALSKGKKNDLICEKCCELGAQNIVFWQGARSIVKIDNEDSLSSRNSRLQRIAEAAVKQSRGGFIPSVSLLNGLLDVIEQINVNGENEYKIYCSTERNAPPLSSLISPMGVHIIIGPEGDFSTPEIELLDSRGFRPISLGPRILRVETAALSVVAGVNALWGFLPEP